MTKTQTLGEKAVERANKRAAERFAATGYKRYLSNPDQTVASRPTPGGRNDV